MHYRNDEPRSRQRGHCAPACPCGFRFPLGDFSFVCWLDSYESKLWPSCGRFGRGRTQDGQAGLPGGQQAFHLGQLPLLTPCSAAPAASFGCLGIRMQCQEMVPVWFGWGEGRIPGGGCARSLGFRLPFPLVLCEVHPSGRDPDGAAGWKVGDLFPGPATESWVHLLPQKRCVFAVMYSLGSEPYGAVVCVFGVIGPLPVLFFTKISCDIHFQGAHITTTFFFPQTLWETGGKGVWHHFPAHGRGCPVYRRRAAKSVERREGKAMGIVIRASWGWHELDFFPGIIVPSRSP